MLLIYSSLFILLQFGHASVNSVPTSSEIPALCREACEQIVASVNSSWVEANVEKLSDPGLASLASRLDTYSPFQPYNSNSRRASKYITRFILTTARRNLEGVDNPNENAIQKI